MSDDEILVVMIEESDHLVPLKDLSRDQLEEVINRQHKEIEELYQKLGVKTKGH